MTEILTVKVGFCTNSVPRQESVKDGYSETAKKLLEIVITRQGIGRGGEIAFIRWNEA